MIFDIDSTKDLFVEFHAAREIEYTAINLLLDALKGGNRDMAYIGELTTRMEDTHNHVMDIWEQLQQHRLDE